MRALIYSRMKKKSFPSYKGNFSGDTALHIGTEVLIGQLSRKIYWNFFERVDMTSSEFDSATFWLKAQI